MLQIHVKSTQKTALISTSNKLQSCFSSKKNCWYTFDSPIHVACIAKGEEKKIHYLSTKMLFYMFVELFSKFKSDPEWQVPNWISQIWLELICNVCYRRHNIQEQLPEPACNDNCLPRKWMKKCIFSASCSLWYSCRHVRRLRRGVSNWIGAFTGICIR